MIWSGRGSNDVKMINVVCAVLRKVGIKCYIDSFMIIIILGRNQYVKKN